jgi:B12-binding domain/radical SAM domain protein
LICCSCIRRASTTFRERAILYGPVSDMVPSSTVFEMYPLGFLTIASYLHDRAMKVRIVNLALRMMNSRRFDVPRFLARLRPKAVGIDLHWLPHAHGALEIARIVKMVHPGVPVIMGGLSSTYFHRELITYPQVDFVLRGDSTEPPLHQLLLALRNGTPVDKIPNLTWKDANGIHVNPLTFVPNTLDYVDLRPDLMVEMVMRYRDLESTLPFNGWWNNPITTVFTVKGCAFECVTCGSSHTSCTHLTKRQKPVYRSPASLVANMEAIGRLAHGPIVLVGDLLMAGPEHAAEVLARLRKADLPNTIVFEFFALPPASFLQDIDRNVRNWSMEFSPESHEQAVRDAQEGESGYTTEDMESIIRQAVALRCTRIDIFFMIGLPAQTTASVRETVEYCGHLFEAGRQAPVLLHLPDGPVHRSGQPRFRGARPVRLPPVCPHAGGAPPAADSADLGVHPQLRDQVDDAARARRRDLQRGRTSQRAEGTSTDASQNGAADAWRTVLPQRGPCALRLDAGMAQADAGAAAAGTQRGDHRASAFQPFATSASCSGRDACSISELQKSCASLVGMPSAVRAITSGAHQPALSRRRRTPQLPEGSVCATPRWQSMQVMPLFARDSCALAAAAGCLVNAMAAGVWQLRHSAESFAFSSAQIFCASASRWLSNLAGVLSSPLMWPQTSVEASMCRSRPGKNEGGTWQLPQLA